MNEKDFINQMEKTFNALGFDVDINQLSDKVKKQVEGVSEKINSAIGECHGAAACKCGGRNTDNHRGCKCNHDIDNGVIRMACQYVEDVKDNDYAVVVLAYGHDENDITVNINPTENCIEISSSLDSKMKDNWFIANVDTTIHMPSNVDYSSLKKYIRNGVLCINGKLFTRQEHKTFSI